MKNGYVRMALIIAALALGLAVLAVFAGFDAVRVAAPGTAQHG
jgi:hypothetical protein